MPSERSGKEGLLPSAVAFFLATGDLPPHGNPAREDGLVQAFQLRYDLDPTTYIARLRTFWRRHGRQIRAVSNGQTPWVQTVLRNPRLLDATESDDEDEPG